VASALDELDLDEEIKRQRAIAALLEDPAAAAQRESDDTAASSSDDSEKQKKAVEDVYGDWKKWHSIEPEKIADTDQIDQSDLKKLPQPTPEEAPPPAMSPGLGAITPAEKPEVIYPTIAEDQGQPDKKFDTLVAESVVPYDEREKPSPPEAPYRPLDTGKGAAPEDYPTIAQDQGAGEKSGEQAPDALTQVERGELWRLPWHPSKQTPVQPPAPRAEPAVDPLVARSIAANIAAQSAPAPVPAAPPSPPTGPKGAPIRGPTDTTLTQPPPTSAPAPTRPVDPTDWRTWITTDGTQAEPLPAVKPTAGGAQPDVTGQDNTGSADYFRKRGDAPITSENDPRLTQINVGGSKWTVHREAAPYFQGFLQELRDQGAPLRSDGGWNYRQKVGAKGLSEHSWAGAIDVNQDGRGIVTSAFQKWIAEHPGALQAAEQHWHIYGGERFGDLGHFEWGGIPGKGGGDGQGGGDVLAQLRSSGLNVTTYGQADDPYGDPDSLAGRGKYVENLIPGYDVALNNAAWNLVGRPKPGQEFTFGGQTFRYGDQVPEKYKDARFDVYDPYKTALSTLGKDTAVQKPKAAWESWETVSPETQAKLDAQLQQQQQAKQKTEQAAIYNLPEAKSSNIVGLYKRLDQPVDNVSDATRTAIQNQLKPEIITAMREKYPEIKSDQEAWDKAQSPIYEKDLEQEWGTKALGYIQQLGEPMKVGAAGTDQFSVNRFLNQVMPNTSDTDKQNYLAELHKLPLDQRAAAIESRLGPGFVQPGNPYRDPFFLAQAIDRLSDPVFQQKQSDELAKFQAEMKRNVSDDPRLKDTGIERIVDETSKLPSVILAYNDPAFWPMALAQVHDQVTASFKQQHPEWDDKTLQDKSLYATMGQFFGGLAAGHLITSGLGSLLAPVKNRIARAVSQAILTPVSVGGINAATTVGTNLIATGLKEPFKGAEESFVSGAIMAAPGGIAHGVGEAVAPREPTAGEQVTASVKEPAAVPEPPPPVRETTPAHEAVYNDLVERGFEPDRVRAFVDKAEGTTEPEILASVQDQMRDEAHPPPPVAEPAKPTTPAEEPASITYTKPAPENVSADLSNLVRNDSLKESAQRAANQVTNPQAKELAQKIANLVPESAKIGVADFSQPVVAGGKQYSGELSAGLYHPDSNTALISHMTNDPVASIIHEATHAALNNAIVNPEKLTPEAQQGVNDIHEAYHDALQLAPVKRPTWMGYALSSPEEFTSAVVSDPRFQQWLADTNSTSTTNPIDRVMQGAARIFGKKPEAVTDYFERAIAGIAKIAQVPPHETRGQGPIYAANPFTSLLGKKVLPRWMSDMALEFRRRTMTLRSNLDAVPETRSLSQAMDYADDTKDALLGKRIATIAEIKRLAKGKESQVTREFQRMAEQIDKGLTPTTQDPATLAIRQLLVKHSAEDAQFMRDNNFHVQLPDGSWRPFVGFADPAQYIPRTMREDVYEALRAPRDPNGNYTAEFIKLFNEGLQKGFFKKPEDLEQYVQHIGQGLVQGPRQTSLETARTIRNPSFFYDYNIDAQVRNLYSSADTRARLEAFGQARPGVPDKFQQTVAEINDSKQLTARQKEIAVLAVKHARDEWYHQNSKGVDAKIIAFAKGFASASQTGNYYTSSKVALARLTSTVQNKGLTNTLRALINTVAHYSDSRETARDLGVLKDTISFEAENLRNAGTMYKKFMAGFKLMQEVALHGEANRFFTMTDTKASQLWLASAVREIQNNPNSAASRMAKEIFARRRVDLNKMIAGDIPETQRFLRQWVNDTQVSYRIMDNPVWSKTPFGKIILQYMPEAYNQTRMLFSETMIPAVKALGRGDSTLGGAYVGRLMWFAAASAGSEELLKEIRDRIFGRDPTAASWGQFMQALNDHNGGLALKVFMERMRDDLVGGVFLGVLGEYARSALNYVSGRNEVAHIWNPNNPPALSVAEQGIELFNRWRNQGGKLSDQDIARFLGNISSMEREVKNIAYSVNIGLKQTTGMELPIPGFSEAEGYRERSFAQAKLRQFYNANPELDSPPGQFRSGPKTPYYANIEDALYAGNVTKAKQIIMEMKLNKLYDANGLKAAMTLRQPLPSGSKGYVFSKWASRNLTDDEWARIASAQNGYARNAYLAGIFTEKDLHAHAPGAAPKGKAALRKAITEIQVLED
jgi:hypothetical protein